MTNQLAPLPELWPEDISRLLANYPSSDGYILSLFRTFANSKRFLQKAVPNLLDRDSPLPLRIREIVILRVTANLCCAYEWGVHVAIFANAAKFTPEQIAATTRPTIDETLWGPGGSPPHPGRRRNLPECVAVPVRALGIRGRLARRPAAGNPRPVRGLSYGQLCREHGRPASRRLRRPGHQSHGTASNLALF
jgi:hypothetical protein